MSCQDCEPGTYANIAIASTTCLGCMPGTYSDISGLTVCRSCEAGKAINTSLATACIECSVLDGRFPNLDFSATECIGVPTFLHAAALCSRMDGSTTDLSGHTAHYGTCVATGFKHLNIFLPNDVKPRFAGLTLKVEVQKEDRYSQMITSDSTSSLQIYSSSRGILYVEDSSINIIGLSSLVLESGRGVFSISIKPTFASVSLQHGARLLRQPFLYVQGTDVQGSAIQDQVMRTGILPIKLPGTELSACPRGHVLVLDQPAETGGGQGALGACQPCQTGKYSVNALSPEGCIACPKSGTCINGNRPIFDATKIEVSIDLDLSSDSDDEDVKQALADKLNVDVMTIMLSESSVQRRDVRKINFIVYGEPARISSLAQNLKTMEGVVVQGQEETEGGGVVRTGEVWEEIDGVYLLRYMCVCVCGTVRVSLCVGGGGFVYLRPRHHQFWSLSLALSLALFLYNQEMPAWESADKHHNRTSRVFAVWPYQIYCRGLQCVCQMPRRRHVPRWRAVSSQRAWLSVGCGN